MIMLPRSDGLDCSGKETSPRIEQIIATPNPSKKTLALKIRITEKPSRPKSVLAQLSRSRFNKTLKLSRNSKSPGSYSGSFKKLARGSYKLKIIAKYSTGTVTDTISFSF